MTHAPELPSPVSARILVADDDRVLSLMICGVLRDAGHNPVPAFDAMQAVMFAMKSPQPDLVLLDISMPGGTGVEALKKLQISSKTAHIPVIVVSGSTDATMPDQVRALGARQYLKKPVEPEQLLLAVNKALRRSSGA